jgi:glycosyltransferase involved in cell wall biosynthesis
MTSHREYRALFLGAGEQMRCGVGQFTRLLCQAVQKLDGRSAELTLTRSEGGIAGIWSAVGSAQAVVCNFPVVAWKRVIIRPLLTLAIARAKRKRVVLIQHEWAGLHWLRRLTYMPALVLSDQIIMFSPLVQQELANDPLVGWAASRCVLAPLPPNIAAPREIVDSQLRQRLEVARNDGRPVIGHFGSIYPGKQPTALLDIAEILRKRGHNPLIVYIGSFIKAFDNVEQVFYARVKELGLTDNVIVSGYVDSDAEVFGLFSEVDAFCYVLEEGLTARRASILTGVQSGKPVVVTGPIDGHEFDHHPRFSALIEHGAIRLVPRGSSPDIYAEHIMLSLESKRASETFDYDGWWRDAAESINARL